MNLVSVMRLLGHRDYRMTLRYAAITPETIGDDHHKAVAQLATKYRLPTPPHPHPRTRTIRTNFSNGSRAGCSSSFSDSKPRIALPSCVVYVVD